VRSKRLLPAIGLALLLLAAVGLAACGSSDSTDTDGGNAEAESGEIVMVDVGTDEPIEVDTSKRNIAYMWTSGSTFMEANLEGVEDEAEKRGFDVTVFDAKFDPLRQVEQIENVLQQGKFDAMIAIPLDYTTLCPILTKQAPSEEVVVVTQDITMCGRVVDEGPEAAPPGILAHSGFPAATDANREFFLEVADRLPEGEHVGALLVGPEGNSSSEGTVKGLEEVEGEIEDKLDVPYVVYTDFTAPDALAKTQTLLQAHPEIDVIMTNYSFETIGAVKAIEEAGLEDQIMVFDQGAEKPSVKMVKEGKVVFTTAFHPYYYGSDSVKAIADAYEGKETERFYPGVPPGSTEEGVGQRLIVDETNVEEFEPEY